MVGLGFRVFRVQHIKAFCDVAAEAGGMRLGLGLGLGTSTLLRGSGLGSTQTPKNLPFSGLIQGNHNKEPQEGRFFGAQVGLQDVISNVSDLVWLSLQAQNTLAMPQARSTEALKAVLCDILRVCAYIYYGIMLCVCAYIYTCSINIFICLY